MHATATTTRSARWAFPALALATVLARLPQLVNAGAVQSDAAIVALQARHVFRGEWSWYLWGVGYQSSLDVLLVALAFAAFGEGPLVLMLVPLVGHVVLTWLAWDVLRRRLGVASATVGVLPLVLAPHAVNIVALYVPRQWSITAVFASFWLLDGAAGSRRPRVRLALGTAIGVASLYLDLFNVQFLVPLLLFAALCAFDGVSTARSRAGNLGAIGLGGAVGAALVWLAWQDSHSTTWQAGGSLERLPENARRLLDAALPWALSARVFATAGESRYFEARDLGPAFRVVQYSGAALFAAGVLAGGAALFARRIPWGIRRLGATGCLVALGSIAGFLVSVMPSDVATTRYLGPIVWASPFALAPAAYLLGPRRFALMLAPYLVAAATAGWIAQSSYVRGWIPVSGPRGRADDERALGAALLERGITNAKADYWLAYRLTYLLGERVLVTPLSAIENRYAPYGLAFDAAPAVALIFHPSEPRARAELEAAALRRSGVPFERLGVAGFTVLVLRTTTFHYRDADGPGLLTLRDAGPATAPGARRVEVALLRGRTILRGEGVRVPIDRDRPFRAAVSFAIRGGRAPVVFEGVLTCSHQLFGDGTCRPLDGRGPARPWHATFRDRADPTTSTAAPGPQAAGGRVRGEVVDHLDDGRLDRPPPVEGLQVGTLEGRGHAARAVDDRAEAVLVERRGHVGGLPPLGAVARHEEDHARQRRAQGRQLPRIRRADDRTHETITRFPPMRRRPIGQAIGDVLIQGFAVGFEVLEVAGRGVARPHEHEQAVARGRGGLHERVDAVAAEVRVDRQRVGVPGGLAAEIGAGVRLGRRADVVALAVDHDDQAASPRISRRLVQLRHPLGPERLVEGRLELDRRHPRRDDVDHLAPERPHRPGQPLAVAPESPGDLLRQPLRPRVDADHRRGPLPPDLLRQPIREVPVAHARPRRWIDRIPRYPTIHSPTAPAVRYRGVAQFG